MLLGFSKKVVLQVARRSRPICYGVMEGQYFCYLQEHLLAEGKNSTDKSAAIFLATCYFQKGGHKNPICHIVVMTSLLTVTENFFVIGFSWCQSDIVNPFSPFCWSEN